MAHVLTLMQMRFATSKPTIYVDSNWVAHTFGRNDGNYIKKTIMFLNALAYAGFDVYPIVDGKVRHHSKISSITRKLKGELDYQSNGNIIKEQKVFAFNDRKGKEDINPFYMLLDKGYRITELAFREGDGQITMQPDFAKADEKFKRHQVLTSSTVASDRSGNERAVRLSKQCGLINRGMHPRTSFVRIDNVWLVWSFQCNFMYKNVN